MPGPWEKYQQAPAQDGPWSKYAAPTAEATPPEPMTSRESFESSMPVRFLRGIEGPAIVALKAFGPDSMKKDLTEIDALRQSGMAKRGDTGLDLAGLFGSLIPGASIGGNVAKALPAATSLLGRMGIGAAAGGAAAAGTPLQGQDELSLDKVKQIGMGAGAGAAVPVVAQTLAAGKAAIEPFYDKGREAIIGRTLNTAAGGQSVPVQQVLSQAKELVPGSQPTVGQASGNAGIASLERAASAISPESTVAFQGREAAQNAARLEALRGIAGTDADRAFAEQARKTSTAPLLEALKNSTAQVDPSRTVTLIDKLIANAPGRTQLTNTLKQVKDSLYDESGNLRANASQLYQGARKNLTDLLQAKAGDGSKLNEAISRELSVVMKSLDHQIKQAEPAYGKFMSDYAAMSKPINRMDVGRAIEEKAANPLTGVVQPNAYARALSDKTAQQATGFKRATLEGTMRPEQMQTLQAIKDDLARTVMARNSAGTAGSDTVKKLAYSNLIDRAGVPTFLREFAPTQAMGNILARGADTLYGNANKEIAGKLAETLLNPKSAAFMMQQAGPSRYQAMIDALLQRGSGAAGAMAGRQ